MRSTLCNLCPRRCNAARLPERGDGFCRCGSTARIARAAIHRGEEPCISGTRGSGAVFFTGCNLRCVFCQNIDVSRGRVGQSVDAQRLGEIFQELRVQGVHNINLVTPSHHAALLSEVIPADFGIPFVWNSGGYDAVEALRLLEGKIQVYMPDLKYLNGDIAARYSAAPDYPAVAKAAILEMFRQVGPIELDAQGLLRRGVLIRHLVLPGCVDDTLDIIDWVSGTFARGEVLFSLMAQYTPVGDLTAFPEINRPLSPDEYRRATDYLYLAGLDSGYLQELGACGQDAIPAFDLTGV